MDALYVYASTYMIMEKDDCDLAIVRTTKNGMDAQATLENIRTAKVDFRAS